MRMCQLQGLLATVEHPASIGSEMRTMRLAAVIAQVGIAQKAEIDAAAGLHTLHTITPLILDKRSWAATGAATYAPLRQNLCEPMVQLLL